MIDSLPWPDPEPGIIQLLRILRDRELLARTNPKRLAYAYECLEQILTSWESHENPKQLEVDLGFPTKNRKRNSKVRRDTGIAIAVARAAFDGKAAPFKHVQDELQIDAKRVERAWKDWGSFYLGLLQVAGIGDHPEAPRAARAFELLSKR